MMYPFMKEWGCVDGKKLLENYDRMQRLGIDLQKWPDEKERRAKRAACS